MNLNLGALTEGFQEIPNTVVTLYKDTMRSTQGMVNRLRILFADSKYVGVLWLHIHPILLEVVESCFFYGHLDVPLIIFAVFSALRSTHKTEVGSVALS